MATLRILGAITLAVLVSVPDAMAQRRGGGGAVSSGMRGAMVGGMVGGSSGAQKGARAGAVVGATRGVAQRSADRRGMDSETQARTQYETSTAYQSAQHSDFDDSAPEVIVSSDPLETSSATSTATSSPAATSSGDEAIISKDGKPVVAITYPADWRQKTGKNWVSAISPKRNAWSVIATLDGAKDKEAGIKKVKQGLEKYLTDVEFDKITKTERGAVLVTGTGKGRKTGIPLVFAVGVFEAAPGQLAGTAFVVDQNAEDYYKEAVRYMCQTIRGTSDLAGQTQEVAKPVIRN